MSYGAEAGPVTLTYEFVSDGRCVPAALAEACLVSYDEGPDPGLGDNTVSAYRAFEKFEVRLDPTFAKETGVPWPFPDAEWRVTQDALIFPTGLGQRLAEATESIQEDFPAAYHENARVWFNEGGFIVEVRAPDPEAAAEGRLAWTTSQNVVPLFITNRTHTWVPLGTAPLDLDRGLDLARMLLTECSFPAQTGGDGVCPGLPLDGVFDTLNATLPQVEVGAWVREASLAAGAPGASEAPSSALEGSFASAAWTAWDPRPPTQEVGQDITAEEALGGGTSWIASLAEARPRHDTETMAALNQVAAPGPLAILAAAAALAAFAAWSLFTRLRREDLLNHATRRAMLAVVEAHPGCVLGHVATAVGVDYKTAQHHLRLLRGFHLLDEVSSGRRTHYFAAGMFTVEERGAIAALQGGSAGALMSAVLAAPGLSLSGLARSTGMSKGGVARQLGSLAEAGLVVRSREGRVAPLHPTALARRVGGRGSKTGSCSAGPGGASA